MMAHLKAMHKDIDKARALREEDKTLAKQERVAEKKAKDETAMAKVPIYSLQTKKQRKDFLDMVSLSRLLLVIVLLLLFVHLLLIVHLLLFVLLLLFVHLLLFIHIF